MAQAPAPAQATKTFTGKQMIAEFVALSGDDALTTNPEYVRGQVELLAWLDVLGTGGDIDLRVEQIEAILAATPTP